jgi:hypothetical protein
LSTDYTDYADGLRFKRGRLDFSAKSATSADRKDLKDVCPQITQIYADESLRL